MAAFKASSILSSLSFNSTCVCAPTCVNQSITKEQWGVTCARWSRLQDEKLLITTEHLITWRIAIPPDNLAILSFNIFFWNFSSVFCKNERQWFHGGRHCQEKNLPRGKYSQNFRNLKLRNWIMHGLGYSQAVTFHFFTYSWLLGEIFCSTKENILVAERN